MSDSPAPERQTNERKSTRFEGVHQRESRSKRHMGKPDVCFSIDYRDPATGQRIRKTIGWRSEGITAELAASMRRELLGEGKRRAVMGDLYVEPASTLTLAEAWTVYHRDWIQSRTRSEAADCANYKNHLSELGPLPLGSITARTVDTLMADLARKGLSPQTVRHIVGLLRRIMRKMVQWKLWRGDLPFSNITLPTLNNARMRYLTPEEARSLLEHLAERSPTMWMMSLISLHCGLRFGEIAALTHGDVDWKTGTLHVRESKSGRARQAVLTSAVLDALRSLPREASTALLFPSRTGEIMKAPSDSFERTVKDLGFNHTGAHTKRGKAIEIKDRRQRVVFHTLRHTYASWLAMSGQGQSMIADLLGHATLEMSRRYTHLMPDARKATAKAINDIFTHDMPPQ